MYFTGVLPQLNKITDWCTDKVAESTGSIDGSLWENLKPADFILFTKSLYSIPVQINTNIIAQSSFSQNGYSPRVLKSGK